MGIRKRTPKYPSTFSGYSRYYRGDYPINQRRHYIPTIVTMQYTTKLALYTEVLTYSATGSDLEYTLTFTPSRVDNVFIFLNGVRQDINIFEVDGQTIRFTEAVPAGWSVIASYSRM